MFPDNRIREWRKARGLTQTELGKLVGLHQTQIGNLENSGRNLSLERGRRIARALGVTLADLLSDDDNPDRLSEGEREIIHNYRDAPEDQQQMVRRVAEPLAPYRNRDEGNGAPPRGGRGHRGRRAA